MNIKKINLNDYHDILIIGWNSPIFPINNQHITIIEPEYYDFFENIKNLTYINKFSFKDCQSSLKLIRTDNPDNYYSVKCNSTKNTVSIDSLERKFDLIIIKYVETFTKEILTGGIKTMINYHPDIIISNTKNSFRYLIPYKHKINVLFNDDLLSTNVLFYK